jgi:oligoendopeptidase F
MFRLKRKFIDSPHRGELAEERYRILERHWRADVELFRDENVPLETEVARLCNEYHKLCGAMTVSVRGQEYTLQQAGRFLEEPDRALRQEAWEAVARRRLADRDRLDDLFDRLLDLRGRIATNAGMGNYRAYVWKAYKRFDYSPVDALRFADAIAATCVPLIDEIDRQRREDLSLPALRPWDMAVDPKGRPALRPFAQERIDDFVQNVGAIVGRLSGDLAADFQSLRDNRNLDLDSRKGKQPGGYQQTLQESRQPFIFMNAAGLQRDVETLLHEGGHAFHCLAARSEPLVFLRSAPMEFCEVASMTMELLGSDHLGVFYNEADAARAKRGLFEGIIRLFPWIATIDSFQHWLYTHPGHSRQQRQEQWLRLVDRFSAKLDWTGHEAVRQSLWHRQLHLFEVPFYYIEYGIAQLGALQVWAKSRQDPQRALANYRAALALGGTRPLPELFWAAGARFDFSEQTLRPLMGAVREELAQLPR